MTNPLSINEKYKTDWLTDKSKRRTDIKSNINTFSIYQKSYTTTSALSKTSKQNQFQLISNSNENKNNLNYKLNKFNLSSPKLTTLPTQSSYNTIINNNNPRASSSSTVITSKTAIINLSYQSPYKTKLTATSTTTTVDKNSKQSSNGYESPFRNQRFDYLRSTSFPAKTIESKMNQELSVKYEPRVIRSVEYSPPVVKYSKPLEAIRPLVKESIHSNGKKLKAGVLFIFNHDKFQNTKNETRQGSEIDVRILKDAFKQFKVTVNIFDNYTVKKIQNQVEKISKENFASKSCIIIAILSHGNRFERIAANDGSYSINDDILFPILRNKTLEGKPKIIIVQACKGDIDLRDYKTDSTSPSKLLISPDEIYKFYSTSEGFVSYRSSNGSIFIQSFCDELKKFGSVKNIRDIMESTIKITKERTGGQQIPSMCVNNTEPYIFGQYT